MLDVERWTFSSASGPLLIARDRDYGFIDTVSAAHGLNAYLQLLKRDGVLTPVGAPPDDVPVNAFT